MAFTENQIVLKSIIFLTFAESPYRRGRRRSESLEAHPRAQGRASGETFGRHLGEKVDASSKVDASKVDGSAKVDGSHFHVSTAKAAAASGGNPATPLTRIQDYLPI